MHDDIIVSGSKHGKVQAWNMETKKKLFEVEHDWSVSEVRVFDNLVLSSSFDWGLLNRRYPLTRARSKYAISHTYFFSSF